MTCMVFRNENIIIIIIIIIIFIIVVAVVDININIIINIRNEITVEAIIHSEPNRTFRTAFECHTGPNTDA